MQKIICYDRDGVRWELAIKQCKPWVENDVLILASAVCYNQKRHRTICGTKIDWSREDDGLLHITPPEIREYAERLVRNLAFV